MVAVLSRRLTVADNIIYLVLAGIMCGGGADDGGLAKCGTGSLCTLFDTIHGIKFLGWRESPFEC